MKNSPGKTHRLNHVIKKAEQLTAVRAICSGLVNITPVLIIGAFALVLKTFPAVAYQTFISSFAGGLWPAFLDFVYSATFGMLSIYMTIFISRAYVRLKENAMTMDAATDIGAVMASLMSFFILAGAYQPGFGTASVGPKSMFLAILTSIVATLLYLRFHRAFTSRRRRYYSTGADQEFNLMMFSIFPILLTTLVFAVFNMLIVRLFPVDSFRELLILAFDRLFSIGKNGFAKGFFFVLLSSLLWFFGIHGSDTLEDVMQTYFAPGLAANQAAVEAGQAPTAILTKEVFDCFVLMGGCGAAICLLLAILLFSRSRARRGLGLAAALPMLFNINELMVFGLPIIYNPILLIPFICVPLVCYTLAYLAIASGLVPVITGAVEWTTPVLLGGFHATGSLAGSLLQVVNIAVGVMIYLPFMRLLERQDEENYRREYDTFVSYFRENEQSFSTGFRLLDQNNVHGEFAKNLCADLEHSIQDGVTLFYQAQHHYDGHCIGVEALLRWKHPVYGMVYPPLVIKLAEEGGFLPKLEETVLQQALEDRPRVLRKYGQGIKVSVNVTGTTVVTPRFLQFCRQMDEKYGFAGKNLCLEVTEQATLAFDESTTQALRAFRSLGLSLAIDDFSMGQTSLNYLKESLFDFIKLDGSLVKGLFTHRNCREIILSLTQLAATLHLTVLAEYVETEEQRAALHEIGCDCYQGYLYAKAEPLPEEDKSI